MKVAIIGIGAMGGPMAANLVKAGYEVTIYDTDAARAAGLAAEIGATSAARLADLADHEAIVTMLPTGQIVRSVFLEAYGGALGKALKPGALVIDMSSSEPVGTQALGAEIAKTGAVLIDAPVSRLVTERLAQARDELGATKDNSVAILAWDKDL